jgi:phosphatidylinositol alpha-1,6-mannosyltransferase
VTRNFPPLLGGMEKFNERLFNEMAQDFDVALCGPEGCADYAPASATVAAVRGGPLAAFLLRLTLAAVRTARRFRPDVVLAGSGLTAPIALLAARSVRARTAVFLYGLDLVVKSRIYQWFWMPAIRAAGRSFPISEFTRRLAIECRVPANGMRIITPGVDMPVLDPDAASEFRRRFGLEGRPLLLAVGRLTRRKGIAEFIEKSLPSIARIHRDVALVVIGGEPVDALAGNRGGAMDRIKQSAAACGVERNVVVLGKCADDVVAAAYQASQVHVFPVVELPGDVEGFGIVALEAAASGLPTVAFRVGGVPDAVGEGISGALVASGDYAGLSAAVLRYLDDGVGPSMRDSCIGFARQFEWKVIGRGLVDALSSPAEVGAGA